MYDTGLRALVESWKAAGDRRWALLSLSYDPLFRLFSDEQRERIVQDSLLCGRQEAARLLQNGSPCDPFTIAQERGIRISSHEYPLSDNRHILLAEYADGEITCSTRVVEAVRELWESENLREILGEADPVAVIISHEIFHYIENERTDIATRSMKIPVKQLGVFTRNVTPYMAGEIAAFAFSKELLGLSFHPRVIELLGVWRFRPDFAEVLTRRLLGETA